MTAQNPTDAEIRATFDEVYPVDIPMNAEGQAKQAGAVAALLIERGWTEAIDEATYRVGVAIFGWQWPDDGGRVDR